MPLLLRHLAAAALPLASTTAGIVAVGIAVHLPTGLSGHISVQAVIPPVRAAAAVVARVAATQERRPLHRTRTPRPTPAQVVAPAPFPRVTGPVTVAATQGPQELSPRQPLPPDEAAPMMPPVAPAPQPAPPPDPVTTLPPDPAEPVSGRTQEHAEKESHRDQRRHGHGVVVVLSTEPPPADSEADTTQARGTDSESDRTPERSDDVAKTSDSGSDSANAGEKGDQNGDGHGDGNNAG